MAKGNSSSSGKSRSVVGRGTELKLSMLDFMGAGAIAGCCTRAVSQPLDVLKIRLQLQLEPIGRTGAAQPNVYTGLLNATRTILYQEGWPAFWKGHLTAQLLSVSYGVAQFASYEGYSNGLDHLAPHTNSHIKSFVCGGLAGVNAILVSQPLDVIRTRLVAQRQVKGYNGISHAVLLIRRMEGLAGFYRGLVPSVLQTSPQTALYFSFYSLFQRLFGYVLDRWRTLPGRLPSTLNNQTCDLCPPEDDIHVLVEHSDSNQDTSKVFYLQSMVAGALSGGCSKFLIYPFDVAKKRLQVQGFEHSGAQLGTTARYRGMTHCLTCIVRKEGFLALYKGLTPAIMKSMVATAVNFTAYELTVAQIRKVRSADLHAVS